MDMGIVTLFVLYMETVSGIDNVWFHSKSNDNKHELPGLIVLHRISSNIQCAISCSEAEECRCFVYERATDTGMTLTSGSANKENKEPLSKFKIYCKRACDNRSSEILHEKEQVTQQQLRPRMQGDSKESDLRSRKQVDRKGSDMSSRKQGYDKESDLISRTRGDDKESDLTSRTRGDDKESDLKTDIEDNLDVFSDAMKDADNKRDESKHGLKKEGGRKKQLRG